jgi:hypothetical protein
MRFFADGALALDAIKKGLSGEDASFKIDGGELSRGGQLLAEIEINRPGSDLFDDEIAGTVSKLQYSGGHAQHVIQRVQATQAVLAVQMLDPNAMELLAPFWTVLSRLANGLWEIEGQGFYDQGQLIVPMA